MLKLDLQYFIPTLRIANDIFLKLAVILNQFVMKKLIVCLIAVFGFIFTSHAQEVKKTVKTTKTVSKPAPVKVEQKTATKKVTTTDQKKTTKTEVVLKKDGTPDKRYKSSKTLKKDGTPDMRYKSNQKTTTTTTTTKK
jgi:hypothetical protein